MRGNTPHVTIGNNELRCVNCGDAFAITMPISISMFAAVSQAWLKDHRGCKPTDKGAANVNPPDVDEWARSWDTGMSSKTIWHFMKYGSRSVEASIPYDPADFGRCHRLLKLAPQWRERLSDMVPSHPDWKPFVEAWSTMEELYEREVKRKDGRAPDLYALMTRLVDESRRSTP